MKRLIIIILALTVLVGCSNIMSITTPMVVENNTGNTIAVVASNENGDVLWENGYMIVEDGEAIIVDTTKESTRIIAVILDFDTETGAGSIVWRKIKVLYNVTRTFTGQRCYVKSSTSFATNRQRIFRF